MLAEAAEAKHAANPQADADMMVEHILQKDEQVFETLLTSDKFFVFHNGERDHARVERMELDFRCRGFFLRRAHHLGFSIFSESPMQVRAAVVHPVPFAALLHLTACVIRAHPRPPQALEAVFEWRRKREEKRAEEVFYSHVIPLPAPDDWKVR